MDPALFGVSDSFSPRSYVSRGLEGPGHQTLLPSVVNTGAATSGFVVPLLHVGATSFDATPLRRIGGACGNQGMLFCGACFAEILSLEERGGNHCSRGGGGGDGRLRNSDSRAVAAGATITTTRR